VAVVLCYCKNEIQDGARTLNVNLTVDWGTEDEREQVNKGYVFCSFRCVASWATDLADRWDNVAVTSPPESHDGRGVTVDEETDHVLRGAA
jgi:hypothetical protein